ncbi:GntR family transcriptional regulator [Jatrophihabitans sp.]|uniref:GntR family transcriptional regulator n=1 Tax=Jatrophihabitans sp. TaxID=1932789 RepID=UPI0030C65A39
MSTPPPLRRVQLPDAIAAHVRNAIMSGLLRPGEFIRLDAIAAELGTSVTPVREALLQLRGEGMVQLLPRRGYVVAPLSRVDIVDLFEIQSHIGGVLIERAVDRIGAEELAGLETINKRLQSAVRGKESAEIERLEYAFHRTINVSADSRKLAYVLYNISKYLPRHFYSADAQWRAAANRDHKRIIEALRAGDAAAARQAQAAHVMDGRERLLKHLDAIDFWETAQRPG